MKSRFGRIRDVVEDEALVAMGDYAWPGNVRELSNAVEAAFIFGRSPTIKLGDLPPAIGGSPERTRKPRRAARIGSFADAERDFIVRALDMAEGNKVYAAEKLKISRKKLYAKIKKHAIGS